MRKVLSIIIILVCCAIYYCSNNPDIIEKYTDFREKRPIIGSDKVGYGGLYGMCYLSDYRIPFSYNIKKVSDTTNGNINLYLFSDSYLYYPLEKHNLLNINKLYKTKWFEENTFITQTQLDPTRKNIIVLEMTERYVRLLWQSFDGICNMLKVDSAQKNTKTKTIAVEETDKLTFLEKNLFNPNINSNLELNMFDYPIFRPFKEWKADFNYHIFNRLNNDIFVDSAKRQLYYMPTVDGEQNMNSFYPIDSVELKTIIRNINKVYRHYKAQGFDEVYLSIIPNPATIIHPVLKQYNNLIPLIQNCDSVKMPIIDMYSIYIKKPGRHYSKSDSHWNSEGLQRWIDEFNKLKNLLYEN